MDEGSHGAQSGSSQGKRTKQRQSRRQRQNLQRNDATAEGVYEGTESWAGRSQVAGRYEGGNPFNPSERMKQQNENHPKKSTMAPTVQLLFDSAATAPRKGNTTLRITTSADGRRDVHILPYKNSAWSQNAYQPEDSEYPALDREALSGKWKPQKRRRYNHLHRNEKTSDQSLHVEESGNWRTRNNSIGPELPGSSGQSQTFSSNSNVVKQEQKIKPTAIKAIQSAPKDSEQNKTTPKPLSLGKLELYKEEVLEEQGKEYLNELEQHQIHLLKKLNNRFPEARFYCRLCDYHVDRVKDVEDHRHTEGHDRKYRLFKDDKFLKNIPLPTVNHIKSLTDMLENLYSQIVLSDAEYTKRIDIVKKLEQILQANDKLKDVCLEVSGSVRSKLATTDSDTNIRIITKKQDSRANVLQEIWTIVQEQDWVTEPDFQFKTRNPFIKFVAVELPNTAFCLTYSEEANTASSELLKWYAENYTLVRKLAILFKYFAKLCKMADADQGTIAAYCYSIMAISFCQLREECPVVLEGECLEGVTLENLSQQLKADVDRRREEWNLHHQYGERSTPDNLGSMWLDLLRFYGVEFKRDILAVSILSKSLRKSERQWGTKRLCVEDPIIPRRNMTNSISHTQVADYILDKIRQAYTYFAIPMLDSGPAYNCLQQKGQDLVNRMKFCSTDESYLGAGEENSTNHDTPTTATTGASEETNPTSNTDDQRAGDGSEVTQPTNSVPSIEPSTQSGDVIEQGEDASDDDYSGETEEHIEDELTNVTDEELSPHDIESEDVEIAMQVDDLAEDTEDRSNRVNDASTISDSCDEQKNDATVDQIDGNVSKAAEAIGKLTLSGDKSDSPGKTDSKKKRNKSPRKSKRKADKIKEKFYVDEDKIEKILYDKDVVDGLKSEDIIFTMGQNEFPFSNDAPPIFCRLCAKPGHLSADCPDEDLPSCLPLPPPSPEHLHKLSDILVRIKDQNQMTDDDSKNRDSVLDDIKQCLLHDFPDVELTLFGSSKNGLGFPDSDLDICMTFTSKKFVGDDENRLIIRNVAKLLSRDTNFCAVNPIPTAKVPICKLYHVQMSLPGDISLYNILAQRNTVLLRRYCDIDDRVRVLGYTVKEFAKRCDIGDASRGALSSYAYTLMMLHYLQHTSPPIIPVLQELYQTEEQPENIVEGWNTWFFEGNNKQLESVWPDFNKNKQSVGELWIGFLEYYSTKFEYKNAVVCIRQHQELIKFEKLWHSSILAIEDPFDLQHNLASGLSKNMHAYIMKAIIHARKHFMTPADPLPDKYKSLYQYLFDGKKLTQGKEAPNDRGCHVCRKIGHIAKSCPELMERKRRQELARKRIHNSNSTGSAPSSPQKPNNPRSTDYARHAQPMPNPQSNMRLQYRNYPPQQQHYPQNVRPLMSQQQHNLPHGQHHHVPKQQPQYNTRPQHNMQQQQPPQMLPSRPYDPIRAQKTAALVHQLVNEPAQQQQVYGGVHYSSEQQQFNQLLSRMQQTAGQQPTTYQQTSNTFQHNPQHGSHNVP